MDMIPTEIQLPGVLEPPVRVVAQPSIFREASSRTITEIPHGATLLDLVLGPFIA